MSLIPFILDLAEELHEFNRCLGTGMDVDDFGFGIYPELQHQHLPQLPSLLRRPRTVSQLYWLPSTKQRPHPYHRNKAFCSKSPTAAFVASEVETPREPAAANGAGQEAASASGATAAKSAYSVVNKNGFQVSMNVKQFAPNELTVKTIDNCIVVEGQHEDKEDGHGVISRHFIRKYMLPKGYDPTEVLSTLSSDGILTVKAPPPPATKTDKPLEHIVDIQQTGPANLSVKETSKEQTKTPAVTAGGVRPVAAITTATASQQQQQELQKVNEHNGNSAADSNNIHAAPTGVKPTAVEDVPETEEMPMCATNNSVAVVAPAAIDAIVAAAAADEHNEDANANIGSGITATTAAVVAATAASVSGESNGGIAVVPMDLADIPDCSDVAVAMETETTDVSETSTALFEPAADSVIAVAEAKEDHTDGVGVVEESSAVPENLVVASATQPLSTAADLVVAADAAILLAKTHCHSVSSGENGNKAAAIPEEVAN